MEMEQKLAKREELFPILRENSEEIAEYIKANLGGQAISPFDLDRVRVPSGGQAVWSIPGIDGDAAEKDLAGIIVHWRSGRSYWSTHMTEGPKPPDCFSDNAVRGVGRPGGDCASCPMAEWGSTDKGTEAQACKEMRLIFLVRPESLLPIVLMVPPTSLLNFRKYLLRLASQAVPYYGVVTSAKLSNERSQSGIPFSKIQFSSSGKLSPEETARVRAYADKLRPSLDRARARVTQDELE